MGTSGFFCNAAAWAEVVLRLIRTTTDDTTTTAATNPTSPKSPNGITANAGATVVSVEDAVVALALTEVEAELVVVKLVAVELVVSLAVTV